MNEVSPRRRGYPVGVTTIAPIVCVLELANPPPTNPTVALATVSVTVLPTDAPARRSGTNPVAPLQRQAEVRVREDVAHAADQAPRDLRRLPCDFVREVLRRLADDFEVADHGITRALVVGEGVVVHSGDETPDLAAGLDDVVRVEPPVALAARRHPPPRARPRGGGAASRRRV